MPKPEDPKTEPLAPADVSTPPDAAAAVAAALEVAAEQAEKDKADAVAEALAKAQLEHAAALEAAVSQVAAPVDSPELEPAHPPIDEVAFLADGYHPPTTPSAMADPDERTGFAVAAPGAGATQIAFEDGTTHHVDPSTGRVTDRVTDKS